MTKFAFRSTRTACGQNGSKEGVYFLLLKDKRTVSLNTYENGKIEEQKTFAITEKSIFATDQKERVAILDPAQNTVILYEIQTSKEIKLSIPYDIISKCILLNNENLFVGGEMGKETLVQYHIQSEMWYNLEIPNKLLSYRKSVDDLVVNDDFLIALDNMIIPKYIVFYQLNTTERLKFSHSKGLKLNGATESIHQGRITPKYFGLRSSTGDTSGSSEHITIYNSLDLIKSFAVSIHCDWEDWEEENTDKYNDFVIIENKLVIASKEKGLGFFKIKNSYFKKYQCTLLAIIALIRPQMLDRDDFNAEVSALKISYKKYRNENIIRLTQIPYTKKIVLTIEKNEKNNKHEIIENIRHEIIEL